MFNAWVCLTTELNPYNQTPLDQEHRLSFGTIDSPRLSSTRPNAIDIGQGEPVVFLHSSLSNKYQWRSLVDRLSKRYRCVPINLMGYGGAAYPENEENFTLIDEVCNARMQLTAILGRDQRFHLVGHSYGGAVALRLAQYAPHSVLSLTLFEPVAFHLLPDSHTAVSLIRVIAECIEREVSSARTALAATQDTVCRRLLPATQLFVDFWGGEGSFERFDKERQLHLAGMLPKVALDFRALLNDSTKLESLRRLNVPTCLVGGRLSPTCVIQLLRAMEMSLPHSVTHWVPAGHMAPITDAIRVNPIIDGFIGCNAQSANTKREFAAQKSCPD
jgi:pimeloyl-ACP methyl ester carboxylesterase